MKIQMSKSGTKERLKKFMDWRDNELRKGKGHRHVKNRYGAYVKIKKK